MLEGSGSPRTVNRNPGCISVLASSLSQQDLNLSSACRTIGYVRVYSWRSKAPIRLCKYVDQHISHMLIYIILLDLVKKLSEKVKLYSAFSRSCRVFR